MRLVKHLLMLPLLLLILFSAKAQNYDEFSGVTYLDSFGLMSKTRFLETDNEGNLWFGYNWGEGGILAPKLAKQSADDDEVYFFSGKDNLSQGVVQNFLEAKDGSIWLGTDNSLRHIEADDTTNYPMPGNTNPGTYRKFDKSSEMVQDGSGNLWVITRDFNKDTIYGTTDKDYVENSSKLWRFKNGNWQKIGGYPSKLPNGTVFYIKGIASGPSGNLVIWGLKKENGKLLQTSYRLDSDGSLVDSIKPRDFRGKGKVQNVGNITNQLIFSFESGLSFYNVASKQWKHYGFPGYSTNTPYDTLPFAAKNYFNGQRQKTTNEVRTFQEAKQQGIWLGMENDETLNNAQEKAGGGLVYYDGNGNFKRYSPYKDDFIEPVRLFENIKHPVDGPFDNRDDSLDVNNSFGWIEGITRDKKGDLIVGTRYSGLWRIPESKLPDQATGLTRSEAKKGFKVYPNPADEQLNIKVVKPNDFKNYNITNLTGQNLRKGRLSNQYNHLNISSLPSGIYLLNLKKSDKQVVEKIIVR